MEDLFASTILMHFRVGAAKGWSIQRVKSPEWAHEDQGTLTAQFQLGLTPHALCARACPPAVLTVVHPPGIPTCSMPVGGLLLCSAPSSLAFLSSLLEFVLFQEEYFQCVSPPQ